MSNGECEYPECPPYELIKTMSTDVKAILQTVNEQAVVNNKLENLIREVREIKGDNKSDHDEIFNRIRMLEMNTLDKKDIIGVITIIGIIFTIISIVIDKLIK